MMLNCDLGDRFEDHQYLTLMTDSFSCTPMGAEYFASMSAILILTSLCDILVTSHLRTKLRFEECAGHVFI